MTPDAVREAAEALLGAIKAEQSWDDPNLDPDNFGCACHGGPVDDPLPMEARPCSSCRAKAVKVRALALEDALRRSALAAPSSPRPACDLCKDDGLTCFKCGAPHPPAPSSPPVEAVAVDHIAAARLVGLGAIVEAERVCGQTRLLTADERVAAADRAVRIVYAAVPPSPSPAPSGVEVAAVREAGLAAYDALPMNEKAAITAQHPRYCYAKGWLAHAQESSAAGKGE